MSEDLLKGMPGMPRKQRSMKLPILRRAPRNPRDVSKGDPVVNPFGQLGKEIIGVLGGQQVGGGGRVVEHPHKPTHVRNTFPDVTEHQQRIFTFTEPTAEISVGGSFIGGRQKYLSSRKLRV